MLDFHTWKIDVIANWESYVRRSTRCRFLYWSRGHFPGLFQKITGDKFRLNQLNYFLMALNDPLDMLKGVRHLETGYIAIDNYKKEIFQSVTNNIIAPVARKIEEELRL